MKMQLKNWSMVFSHDDPYLPPELVKSHLQGEVYNDSRRTDGTPITTSHVVGQRNGLVITRSGSEYELLEPSADYESLFPNARERILKHLNEI